MKPKVVVKLLHLPTDKKQSRSLKKEMAKVVDTADIIVIGGGVAGLSTALQLAARGKKVIVLERAQLGSGSTGRAAGLLGQLRSTAASTRMLVDGLEIVRELEGRTETEIFIQTGSLRLAETAERAQEVRALTEVAELIGFEVQLVDRRAVVKMLPYMKTDDLLECCYCESDGHLQPAELVAAYIKVGRSFGVTYKTHCPVERVLLQNNKALGVGTAGGEYHAPVIVNAAGPWSYLVAELAEETLATAALGHYYLTTRPNLQVAIDRLSPAIRDRHHRIYSRPEGGGLIVGMYEAEPKEYDMETLPTDFDMQSMKAARDDINVATLIHAAHQRFPWISERTPMTITTGLMTFTPDGKPFCGKRQDLDGLFHCAGFCGHGIVQSPTIGVIMSDLIIEGKTTYDIDEIDADRFFDVTEYNSRAKTKAKCYKTYSNYYGSVENQKRTG